MPGEAETGVRPDPSIPQLPPGPKCLHGGQCQDDVDDFLCSCTEDYFGTYCECMGEEDDSNSTMECADLNTTLSWTLPPYLLIDIEEEDVLDAGVVSTIVAGASVTVGWAEVTEVAGTVMMESSDIMATVSRDLVQPTPSFPGEVGMTASVFPDFNMTWEEEELGVDIDIEDVTVSLAPSYTVRETT